MEKKEISKSEEKKLREEIVKKMNGEYAYDICRNCRSYKANIDGNYKTANIREYCSLCAEQFLKEKENEK